MTDITMEDVVRTFVAEAAENLFTMEEALLALERHPDDEETINTIFRMAHSVKGGAAIVGYELVADFAHVAESLLDRIRKGSQRATTNVITALLHSVDVLRELMADLECGGLPQLSQPEAKAAASHRTPNRTVRVDAGRLDRMVDLAGEIAIARGRMRQMIDSPALLEAYSESERLFLDLQELVMKTRMVPVGTVFAAFNRTVRDLAREQGKIARLIVTGEDVEIDHGVVEKLRDPITHMIRNAVDHGIEAPEVRSMMGKDPCGRISVSALHEGGMIVIRVSDDGRGIDRARVGDDLDLIFTPGFSTAAVVNEVSGRGVGMDVVKRNVESLHGSVSIESSEGAGTTVTTKLPLTLAIIEGFGVSVGEEHYVIPLPLVTECMELGRIDGQDAGGPRKTYGVLDLRGDAVPYVRLGSLFGLDAPPVARENVVIVECGDRRAGLAVDHLHGHSQVVVKPMSELFRSLPGISGSAILGNGRVALILDVPVLLELVRNENA